MNLYLFYTKWGNYYVLGDDTTSAEIKLREYVKDYGEPEIKEVKYLANTTNDLKFKTNKMLVL